MSLPSGSLHGRQTQLLLGLEGRVCEQEVEYGSKRHREDGMWGKKREKGGKRFVKEKR